jgi:cytoskeletal protein CcmA (bactofilin family)
MPKKGLKDPEIISKETSIEGNMTIQKDLFLNGTIHGDLHVKETLYIGTEGVVIGNVHSGNTIIEGSLNGDLMCGGSVKLLKGSVLVGDLFARSLTVNETSVLQGVIHLLSQTDGSIESVLKENRKVMKESKNEPMTPSEESSDVANVEHNGQNGQNGHHPGKDDSDTPPFGPAGPKPFY